MFRTLLAKLLASVVSLTIKLAGTIEPVGFLAELAALVVGLDLVLWPGRALTLAVKTIHHRVVSRAISSLFVELSMTATVTEEQRYLLRNIWMIFAPSCLSLTFHFSIA